MEIIKPGKVRRVKLECPECGCEFVCSPVEMVRRYGTVFAKCPQEGCGRSVEVPNGIPEYIEPANHTAIGTITVMLSKATVWEIPGCLLPTRPTTENSTNRSDTCNGYKEIYCHSKNKG